MSRIFLFLLPVHFSIFFVACSGGVPNNSGGTSGMVSGTGVSDPAPSQVGGSPVGSSCKTGDPSHYCLAVKYVVYKDSKGQPVVDQSGAVSTINGINKVWTQCNIAFQIEEYLAVDPTQAGLDYRPLNDSDMSHVRSAYVDSSTLLVATTGTWDRTGTLGNTGANAWTSMPGDAPYGAVLEKPVGTFANIIAHELGHYLNLPHVADTSDLMNPIIYDSSTNLSSDQCSVARQAIGSYWQKMIR